MPHSSRSWPARAVHVLLLSGYLSIRATAADTATAAALAAQGSSSTCTASDVALCRRRSLFEKEARIIGGAEVCPFAYPHVVPLLRGSFIPTSTSFNQWYCGGTLYKRQFVITAAHCVYDAEDVTWLNLDGLTGLSIEVHRHDLTEPLCTECAVRIAVASVAPHPDFDGWTYENDVAVLRLAEPVPENYDVSVALDYTGIFSVEGQSLLVAGWGATSTDPYDPAYADQLHAVSVEYISNSKCTSPNYSIYSPTDVPASSECFKAIGVGCGAGGMRGCALSLHK
jgi:secreted trypsin-like serine protease